MWNSVRLAPKRVILIIAAILIFTTTDAHARDGVQFAPGSQAARVIQLTIGKAEIIDLPAPAVDILIGNSGVADAQIPAPRRLYLFGRGIGDTTIFVMDGLGEVVTRLDVHVRIDEATFRRTIRELLPRETAIEVKTINRDVILTGTVSSPAAAEKVRRIAGRFIDGGGQIIDMMSVAGEQQVLLRVRVMEVNRTSLFELGVSPSFGDGIDTDNTVDFIFSTLAGFGLTSAPFGAATLFLSPGGEGPLSFVINALEQDGFAQTLSEPNLTAVTGETAQFLVGGEFPVPVGQDDDGSIGIEFRPFGVSLAFTPTILSDDRISLHLGTEVSALSTEGAIVITSISIPSLTVRRAETVVEMGSGNTLMLAGLIESELIKSASGLPGFKDIPIFGRLARSDSFTREETELVILVTALLVEPFSTEQANRTVALDGTGPVPLGLRENLEQRYGEIPLNDDTLPEGSYGYLLD